MNESIDVFAEEAEVDDESKRATKAFTMFKVCVRAGRRGDLIYDLLDGSFNLADLSVEFTNEADGMLKFKRFGGHGGANGSPGGIANFNGFGTAIVPFGSGGEEVGEVCEMAGSDLLCAEEFGKQRIDRRYVERGDEFFQFREQDGDKSGNRLFQFSTLANLVKSVPGS